MIGFLRLSEENLRLLLQDIPNAVLAVALVNATKEERLKVNGVLSNRAALLLAADIKELKAKKIPLNEIKDAQKIVEFMIEELIND